MQMQYKFRDNFYNSYAKPYMALETKGYNHCVNMMAGIQNLIWALGLEANAPQPQRCTDSMLIEFIQKVIPPTMGWQNIKVNHGPKNNEAMLNVLKAARDAIQNFDLNILIKAKEKYKGEYDQVQTTLNGVISMSENGGYAGFADFFGTITDQPGYLINNKLTEVNELLDMLPIKKHDEELERDSTYRF